MSDPTFPLLEQAPAVPLPTSSSSASSPATFGRDLKLDTTTGDLALSGGDLVLVSGTDAIAQDLRMRLRFFAGEWFADLDAGVPYFSQVLVKNPDVTQLRGVFRDAILATPGVKDLLELDLDFDSALRTLTLTFKVDTDLGELNAAVTVP